LFDISEDKLEIKEKSLGQAENNQETHNKNIKPGMLCPRFDGFIAIFLEIVLGFVVAGETGRNHQAWLGFPTFLRFLRRMAEKEFA